MSVTREQVLDKLDSIPEPCALLMHDRLSICEMGLVDSVRIDDGHVRVELVLTDTSCIHLASMSKFITDSVGELDGVDHVDVIPSTSKLWSPDRVVRKHARPTGQGRRIRDLTSPSLERTTP